MNRARSKKKSLIFKVVKHPSSVPKSAHLAAFLIEDNWDDWGKYQTTFRLVVFDETGMKHLPGEVKIGQVNLKPAPKISKGHRMPEVPLEFTELDEHFFSLGQSDIYYETLAKLHDELRNRILTSLRDVVADQELWQRTQGEEVTLESLLRSVTKRSVEGQFRRLIHGGARLTPYRLTYTPPKSAKAKEPPYVLTFNVTPDSCPPTNIHVLIGPNGVGKTYLLQLMTKALIGGPSQKRVGTFSAESPNDISLWPTTPPSVANLVSVSFSAFDDFELLPEKRRVTEGIQYSYVGLKRISDTGPGKGTPKSPAMLVREFIRSLKQCLKGVRAKRWTRAVETLQSDPIFKAANLTDLTKLQIRTENFAKRAEAKFNGLSAGHRVVLLTITRLVETVEEQTLILFDEPEAHLHPPLLSAFVRSLSELLIDRNGLAIIATHSPVVLQEVPKTCVWMLQRSGEQTKAERPSSETFGENVGVLTREAFGLETTQAGFHNILNDVVQTEQSFDSALGRFHNQLGAEARAILRGLLTTKTLEGNL